MENADDAPLDDDVQTIFIADDTEPDATFPFLCLLIEEKGSFQPVLPLKATLVRTLSFS